MVVVTVSGYPSMTKAQKEKLSKEILDAVVGVKEFNLKKEDVACRLRWWGLLDILLDRVVIKVTGLDRMPNPAVKDLLTVFLSGVINRRFPRVEVKCSF